MSAAIHISHQAHHRTRPWRGRGGGVTDHRSASAGFRLVWECLHHVRACSQSHSNFLCRPKPTIECSFALTRRRLHDDSRERRQVGAIFLLKSPRSWRPLRPASWQVLTRRERAAAGRGAYAIRASHACGRWKKKRAAGVAVRRLVLAPRGLTGLAQPSLDLAQNYFSRISWIVSIVLLPPLLVAIRALA